MRKLIQLFSALLACTVTVLPEAQAQTNLCRSVYTPNGQPSSLQFYIPEDVVGSNCQGAYDWGYQDMEWQAESYFAPNVQCLSSSNVTPFVGTLAYLNAMSLFTLKGNGKDDADAEAQSVGSPLNPYVTYYYEAFLTSMTAHLVSTLNLTSPAQCGPYLYKPYAHNATADITSVVCNDPNFVSQFDSNPWGNYDYWACCIDACVNTDITPRSGCAVVGYGPNVPGGAGCPQ